jgi:hypothetical protein
LIWRGIAQNTLNNNGNKNQQMVEKGENYDPAFGKRAPMDKLVYGELNDDATAHMTEDGYVRHRILEMTRRRVA